ncbi:MAG: hypothetical protein APR63_01505 [Desulfuromonas sp. SDB]|nr:MAG: hypothetical protein APR63_01505 [Desulfuromonas sp. SDB]
MKVLGFISKIQKFLIESKQELFRVSWPKKNELWDSTLVVIFVSIILAIFIGVFDRIFTFIISLILG